MSPERASLFNVDREDHERKFVLLELAQLRLRDVRQLSCLRLPPKRGGDDRLARRDVGLNVWDHGEAWGVWHAHGLLQHVDHERVRENDVVEAVIEQTLAVTLKPVMAARVGVNVKLDVP